MAIALTSSISRSEAQADAHIRARCSASIGRLLRALALTLACGSAGAATFTGIGDLPGGFFMSSAQGVSRDGRTVVGSGLTSLGTEGLRWTAAGGAQSIGELPGGGHDAIAYAVSAYGDVIVGLSRGGLTPPNQREAFRWSSATGIQPLGGLTTPFTESSATAVSDDGNVIVGTSTATFQAEAFRWTASGGMQRLETQPANGCSGQARGVSADGSVVVGLATSCGAFRWTEAGGFRVLGSLTTPSQGGYANAVTPDGAITVGVSWAPSFSGGSHPEAARWNASGAVQSLGALAPGANSEAMATSADGRVVVGVSHTRPMNNANVTGEAFIWVEGRGMRSLEQVLQQDHGLDLSGWMLISATGISGDGLTIVGNGIGPNGQEGWVANLNPGGVATGAVNIPPDPNVAPEPPPATCLPGRPKGLIFATHGWNSNADVWAKGTIDQIKARVDWKNCATSVEWHFLAFDWRQMAASSNPLTALGRADEIGMAVGASLRGIGFDYIHFIGHSAGARLVDSAINAINDSPSTKKFPREVRATFLDAYDPSLSAPYGQNAHWAEQFVDTRRPPFTNSRLNYAFNVDVTDASQNPYLIVADPNVSEHGWPYRWYVQSVCSVAVPGLAALDTCSPPSGPPYLVGWPLTRERLGLASSLPDHDNASFARGTWCKLSADSYSFSSCSRVSRGEVLRSLVPAVVFGPNWTLISAGARASATGFVDFSTAVLRLFTGSPVWVTIPVTTPATVDTMQFVYRFPSNLDGYLSVYVDNQLVHTAKAQHVSAGQDKTSSLIPLEPLAPGAHTISFRLDSSTPAGASVEIPSVTLGALQYSRSSNLRPAARVGPDQVVRLTSPVQLDGSSSSDPDSGPQPLTYRWWQTGGPVRPLSSSVNSKPTFSPTVPGNYFFTLTVSDGMFDSFPMTTGVLVPPLGDIDLDGDVDSDDLARVNAVLNTNAAGRNDLRDLNGDGVINALDARKLVTLCTRPRCATK